MNSFWRVLLGSLFLLGACKNDQLQIEQEQRYLTSNIPYDQPLMFKPDLVADDSLEHRGVFTPGYEAYYYTVSDKEYERFDIKFITVQDGVWSVPKNAPFNSSYNDHGLSFSPDGLMAVFSSTRPAPKPGIANTWHLWKSTLEDGIWQPPTFIDIPNLDEKLISHPSVTQEGNLYFHVSETDYSNMDIYRSKLIEGSYEEAHRINLSNVNKEARCTPFISPTEDYLIFAAIGKYLTLQISYKEADDQWSDPKPLPSTVNQKGQGNPFVTTDGKFLFYTAQHPTRDTWKVHWVHTKRIIEN